MKKESFDDFKQLVKEWLDTHPKEYGSFVKEMNRKDIAGIQKVFKLAKQYAPKYKSAVINRLLDDTTDNFDSLEKVLIEANIAEKIVGEFHSMNKKSIVPAMLAWLYYGRCFETWVERCDNLRKDKKVGVLYRWMIFLTIKYTINKSISSGMRTKEDWKEFKLYSQLHSVDGIDDAICEEDGGTSREENAATNALSSRSSKRKAGQHADGRTLEELLKPKDKDKEQLLAKIKIMISKKKEASDIARLKIALHEMDLLHMCGPKAFHRALSLHYNITLVGLRGVQDEVKRLTSFIGYKGKMKADMDVDRKEIDAIKAFLSKKHFV